MFLFLFYVLDSQPGDELSLIEQPPDVEALPYSDASSDPAEISKLLHGDSNDTDSDGERYFDTSGSERDCDIGSNYKDSEYESSEKSFNVETDLNTCKDQANSNQKAT